MALASHAALAPAAPALHARASSAFGSAAQLRPARPFRGACPTATRAVVVAAADGDADAAFEERLAKLRAATGRTGSGAGKKAEAREVKAEGGAAAAAGPVEDWAGEVVEFDGPPHRGDLATNVALGTTLVWLPLTLAAVGRALWVNYKFTNKRVSVRTTPPWATDEPTQVDVAYGKIAKVVTVGRGVGLWGDMVLTLKDGSVVELRSLGRHVELKQFVEARMAEAAAAGGKGGKAAAGASTGGFGSA